MFGIPRRTVLIESVLRFRPIAIVLRDAVAGEQEPCARLERERILVLLLHGQIVLTYKCLEDAVIVNVLRRQVGEDVSQLAEKLRRLETLVQSLPGYIGHVLIAEQHIVQHTEQYAFPGRRHAHDDKALLRRVDRDEEVAEHLLNQTDLLHIAAHRLRKELLK